MYHNASNAQINLRILTFAHNTYYIFNIGFLIWHFRINCMNTLQIQFFIYIFIYCLPLILLDYCLKKYNYHLFLFQFIMIQTSIFHMILNQKIIHNIFHLYKKSFFSSIIIFHKAFLHLFLLI